MTPAGRRAAAGDEGLPPLGPARDAGVLRAHLELLAARVRAVVEDRRAVDAHADDAFRGLYVTDEDFERLAAGNWPPMQPPSDELVEQRRRVESLLPGTRLDVLAERFGLEPIDLDLLLIALASDLDARFEKLYGYLNDDVTRRRATIGLALELCGQPAAVALGRNRFNPDAPLIAGGLVLVEDDDRPLLTRSLRVPDRVSAHLLGDDTPPPELLALAAPEPGAASLDPSRLASVLEDGTGLVYLRERPGTAGRLLACLALEAVGKRVIGIDLTRLDGERKPAELQLALGREARLLNGGVVAGPLEALGEGPGAIALARALAELPAPVLLFGRQNWDPAVTPRVPLLLEAPMLEQKDALAGWAERLGDSDAHELAAATSAFLLSPEQVARAATAAQQQARYAGSPVSTSHVRHGALAQNAAGLERLARRIEPGVGFDDLVLPPITVHLLEELVGRMRNRDEVLGSWRMRPGSGRGRGVTALFAGESGTGKTMAAEVIAHALGIELYTINLATVVDKYVGETEKNLERIFTEATGVNGVLLFDEADALFGKRSEVREANDRYANIEVAYLLQRIESFDGLAVLSTNLRANVDEAFTRRFDAVVDFPFPDAAQRRQLWERCLGSTIPRAEDVDLDFLAGAFELSGGNIRAIALTAAYLAASTRRVLEMADLIKAVNREYRKLGRLSVRAEFGPWYEVVAMESGSGWDDEARMGRARA